MTKPKPPYHSLLEEEVLERLRPRFETLGYDFVVQPGRETLPAFMKGWIPDAIATRGSDKVAIEVKGYVADPNSIRALHARFRDQDQWRLAVVTSSVDLLDVIAIPESDIATIRRRAADIELLLQAEQPSAGLIMSFALLEAVEKVVTSGRDTKPKRPGTVVQSLAVEGYVETADEERLRSLVDVRNRIVHGDLGAEVKSDDVRFVLAVIDQTLAGAFAV